MAICIMNQNSAMLVSSFAPRTLRKMRKYATAMNPYIPTCHALSEKVSALTAATMP